MDTLKWAVVPMPNAPFQMIHRALYAYYPGTDGVRLPYDERQSKASTRPCLWRVIDRHSIGILSVMTPSTEHVEVLPIKGRVMPFKLLMRTDRELGRHRRRVSITDPAKQKEKVCAAVNGRGAEVTFIRADNNRTLQFEKGSHLIKLNVVDITGHVLVTDPAEFSRFMAFGGPGTGKAYGCGLWYIPEIMTASTTHVVEAAE